MGTPLMGTSGPRPLLLPPPAAHRKLWEARGQAEDVARAHVLLLVAGRYEGAREARCACARSAPAAVHERLHGRGQRVVHDVGDVGHVEAARRDVRGDEHTCGGGAELVERGQTRALLHACVERLQKEGGR